MPYQINPRIRQADYVRHNTKERHYIDELREKGLLIEVDNIAVDGEQLVLRTFQCDTGWCVKCKGSAGSKEYKGSCCTDLQVDVTAGEMERVRELALKARSELNLPRKSQLARIVDNVLNDKITEVTEDHELALRHKRNGSCVMSWIDGDGLLRCSINTFAYRLGLPIEEYKPDPCYVFPLHYAQLDSKDFILSVLCEETRFWIEQHECVGKLRCLRTPQPGSPPAYQFLRYEIEYLLGAKFYKELDRQARPMLERYLEEQFVSAS